jgi:hypothetical protein
MEKNKVAFEAMIKQVNSKSFVSGDKGQRITIDCSVSDEVLNEINKLHKGDKEVMVAFVEIEDGEFDG